VALRRFHGTSPAVPLRERNADRDELLDACTAYGDYLADRLGRPAPRQLAAEVRTVLASVLPSRLELAVGHGDFAPRNVFALAGGQVALFDPMPCWACPPLEDVSRFTVGTRLLGLQVYTQGQALGATVVDRLVESFRDGYAGDAGPDPRQVRAYELLVLLDKWSAMAGGPGSGGPARRRWTGRYVRRVATRLVREARSA
jgi:hypothetical protein